MGLFNFFTEEIAIDLGTANTLIIHNEDTPGCIAEVTMALALRRINIASM